MNGNTIATLNQLFNTKWFSNVGVQDTTSARVLSNWDEAVASCSTSEWDDLQLEAINRYRERIAERSRDRLKRWNEVLQDVKPTVLELLRVRVAPVAERHGLPEQFTSAVRWDLLNLCMESEFADVYPPGFFAAQAYWYSVGHFPCGWDGEFPNGTRVIY